MVTFTRTPIGLGVSNPAGILYRNDSPGISRADIADDLEWLTKVIADDNGIDKGRHPIRWHRRAPAIYQF